jgi:hypothetical protein
MKVIVDYPKLRETVGCPLCGNPKSKGIVICWTCNGHLKARYDGTWGKKAVSQLDFAEAGIA